jgi:hypothetical protein
MSNDDDIVEDMRLMRVRQRLDLIIAVLYSLDKHATALQKRAVSSRVCRGTRSRLTDPDVDVARLQDAPKIGLVRCACAQSFNRRFLVPERLKKEIWKLGGVERLLGEHRDGFLDLNGIHAVPQNTFAPAPNSKFASVLASGLRLPAVDKSYFPSPKAENSTIRRLN